MTLDDDLFNIFLRILLPGKK